MKKNHLICLSIFLSSFSLIANADDMLLREDVNKLKEDVLILQRKVYHDKNDTTAPEASVSNFQIRLGEYDELIRNINGKVENIEYRLNQLEKKLDGFDKDIELRFEQFKNHLADGSAFGIFNTIDITCPIIFTTAYDQYALKAFDVNSIDYLLKPIDTNKLHRALDKFQNFSKNEINKEQILKLIETMRQEEPTYRRCLLVPKQEKLVLVECSQIAFIYIDTQVIKMITINGEIYFMNDTLEDIYRQLDPRQFYRANRQQIVNRDVIKDISTWFGSKILVSLKIATTEKITISKGRAAEFKKWLAKN